MQGEPHAKKATVEVKTLRPWVKKSLGLFAAMGGYLVVTRYLLPPKPYVIEFDMQKVQEMRDRQA